MSGVLVSGAAVLEGNNNEKGAPGTCDFVRAWEAEEPLPRILKFLRLS